MNSDFLYILNWWLLLFLLGACFLPITTRLFSQFFDKGYIFSKVLGIIITSYVVFLLGTLHIAPFRQITIFLVIIVLTIGSTFFLLRSKKNALHEKDKKKQSLLSHISYLIPLTYLRVFLFEEVIFFATLWYWSYVRGFSPDIHGLEKYMDFGFVNSILRATYFPPKDMWFTPYPINYYYFGHFATATLTKLSGISSNISFNLMLATLFAFCFTGAFSLGANFWYFLAKGIRSLEGIKGGVIASKENGKQKTKKNSSLLLPGFLSAILLTFGGNLHILYAFFKSYGNDNPIPLWQLPFLPNSFPNGYWYPNATRFIYHTIHEFPIYSFVVSDLHGHVLDIPFVLFTIALLFSIFVQSSLDTKETSLPKQTEYLTYITQWISTKWYLLLIGFLLAVMYMTNAWDGLMYFVLAILAISVVTIKKYHFSLFENAFFVHIIPQVGVIFICYVLFSLPFSLFFQVGEIAHGIGVLCAPQFLIQKGQIGPFLFEANHCQHSPWWQLAILYGFFYIWAIPFIVFMWKKLRVNAWLNEYFFGKRKTVNHELKTVNYSSSDLFVLLLIVFATLLIIIPEFVYLKDIYPEHYRANTMFKLVYQAFILLSLCSAYIIVRFLRLIKSIFAVFKRKVVTLLFLIPTVGLLILIAVIYPYYAITSYYGNLQTYHSLDGTVYLKTLYPSDYDAIQWINKHIAGQPVILEAQGDSYTDYARVSANTGLPTVLGWTVHEWLWRGSYDVPAPRIVEVETLYTTTDIPTAQALIKKYHIQYVFVGALERQKYPNIQIAKFNELGKIIYQNGDTMIYQLSSH